MSIEKRYRVPLVSGLRRKSLVLAAAFAVPVVAAGVLVLIFPELKPLIAGLAVTMSILLVSLLSLLMWLSTSFVIEVDKVSKWGILRRGPELAFDDIATVLTVPDSSTAGLVTLLFADDVSHDDPYKLASQGQTAGPAARVKEWLVGVNRSEPGIGSEAKLSIPSHTEHYPELLAEISRRARHSLVDPFTRMVAGFTFPTSALDREYGRRARRHSFTITGDLDSARFDLSRFELEKARGRLQSSAAADPRSADAWHLLGMVHLLRRRMEDSETALERAAELRPGDADIRFRLGIARFYAGEFEEARDEFRAALELKRDDPVIAGFFGCASTRIGAWEDAISASRGLETHASAVAAQSARKCLDCIAGTKELVDQGKVSSAARRARMLTYVAFGLIAIAAGAVQIFLRDARGGGQLAAVLAVLAAAAIGYGRNRLSNILSPDGRGPVPCWLRLGWMKAEVALAATFGISRGEDKSVGAGTDNASQHGGA